ncbi:MAG TPA: flagellar filament capping protein FliD [Solirubrobacteraceae bacterium]|jgi:flagellar hook-associated protein 2|nr:flagellar filament capping protein FliD [Solirubrobacteraceae bacterium]
MADNLALSGLASGVDTSAIVSQLMALERQRTTRMSYRQAAVNAQRTGLTTVAAKLSALQSAAKALGADSSWAQRQTAESSDAKVAVALVGGAGIGGHTVQVDRLASSMQRGFTSDATTGGTIHVESAADPAVAIDVTVAAGATLQSVADTINARSSGPVVAAIVKDGDGTDRLVLSSRKTGSSSDFAVTAAGVLTADDDYTSPDLSRLNASYSIDGVAQPPSQTNVLESAVPGLRITLKGVTSSPATVTVSEPTLDRTALKAKVTAFVDAYNAVVDTTRSALTEKPITSPGSSFQAGLGQLHGDTGLTGMLSRLRSSMTEVLSGSGLNDLSDLGITVPKASGGATSDAAKGGRLVIDAARLDAVLEGDATQVKAFFAGFDAQVDAFVKKQTSGIDDRLKGSERTVARIQSQIDATNERLDAKEARLKAQFAAMELALQNSQTQQAWLTGQLAALNANQ